MSTKLDNSNVSVHLGQTSQYKSTYDETLLVREPRINNREHLDISDDTLPFTGYDVWNAYEISALTDSGVPITGYAKVIYTCENPYIVESKSIKLYFNSFNMTKLGNNAVDVLDTIEFMSSRDLSILLDTKVQVKVYSASVTQPSKDYFRSYLTLEDILKNRNIECDTYNENPDLIESLPEIHETPIIQRYHSSLLKSNCRVTSQPDWGDVYIYMNSVIMVAPESLMKYIISFRDECHFHEEICETIYKRLYDIFSPEKLAVACLYVRRGGIDINPFRSSHESLLQLSEFKHLLDIDTPFVKTSRQ
jgi:7-cyano-7-deazaguanine reductase